MGWESWPGDTVETTQDEGHFYLECSNQGLCDRGTGECECFDGYSGVDCASTGCPDDCSGNGRCLTIAEMARAAPIRSGNTIEVTWGSHFVSTELTPDVAVGDSVYLGEQADYDAATVYTVTGVVSKMATDSDLGNQGFTVSPRAQASLPFGSALYKVANPSTYTKQNERQMLTMDSSRGALSGSFTLTFTSVNGEKKTTAPLPTAPELSSTVTVSGVEVYDDTYCKNANAGEYGAAGGQWAGAACEKLIRFSPDLPDDELAVNDYIRIGNEIRQIGSLTRSTDSGNYSSAFVTAQFDNSYAAGTYAYRHSAAKVIEYGLEHLSNDVVGEVTATKTKSSGRLLTNADPTAKLHTIVAAGGSAVTFGPAANAGFAPGAAGVGDVFRVHSQGGMSQIEAIEENTTSLVVDGITLQGEWLTHASDTSELTAATRTIDTVAYAVGHQPIIDNGFKYKIKFEDNSGDLPDLTCNTNDLRSVYRLKQAAYVSRDEPDRVWFVDTKQGSAQPSYYAVAHADMTHPSAVTAGDTIYVGEQRCDVVSSDADSTAGLKGEGSAVETYHSSSVVC